MIREIYSEIPRELQLVFQAIRDGDTQIICDLFHMKDEQNVITNTRGTLTIEDQIQDLRFVTKLRSKALRDFDDVVMDTNLRATDLNILLYAIWCKQHEIVTKLMQKFGAAMFNQSLEV